MQNPNHPTSCYVPLSTPFADDGYGAQFLPRVNSKVMVSFINGDPDLPIDSSGIHFKTPNFDANSGNGGVSAEEVKGKATVHDRQMQLMDEETGEILSNHRYRLVASSGEEFEGVTDANGMTERLGTDHMAVIDIELLD